MACVLALALTAPGCSAVDSCRLSCDGCCDARGSCREDQAWACGRKGNDCFACEPGQKCSVGECTGVGVPDRLDVFGTNAFVPKSAQAFTVSRVSQATSFIAVSNLERPKCRDPYASPAEGEQVLLFSSPNGVVDPIALLTPADGGVRHQALSGSSGMSFSQGVARVDFDIRGGIMLSGSIEAPLCGEY